MVKNIIKLVTSMVLVSVLVMNILVVPAYAVSNYSKIWNYNFGGSGDEDLFVSVVQASDGGYVAVGTISSTDYDMAGRHKGGWCDAMIVKYNENGSVGWSQIFGGNGYDYFRSVAETSDGGFVVAGTSSSTDQDLAGKNKGDWDAIIVKYDKNGIKQWNYNFGGSNTDDFWSVKETKDGGFIAVGSFRSSDQDLAGKRKGGAGFNYDAMIVKFDKNGTKQWVESFGGSDYDYFYSVVETSDGSFVTVGESASVDQDLATKNLGGRDAVIAKFDKNGAKEWNHNYGGPAQDRFNAVVERADGGFLAVGDGAIVKYRANGTVEWHREAGGQVFDVTNMSDGGFAVATKVYMGSASWDEFGILGKGDYDAIVMTFDEDGEIQWAANFGGEEVDAFEGIVETSDGALVVVGKSMSWDQDLQGKKRVEEDWTYDAIIVKYHDLSNPGGTITTMEEEIPIGTTTNKGCNPVRVTLKTNVPVQTPAGWTRINSRTFKKTYTANQKETVALLGLNGKTGEATVIVDSIKCTPSITPSTPSVPNTGLTTTQQATGLAILMLLVVSTIVALIRRYTRASRV